MFPEVEIQNQLVDFPQHCHKTNIYIIKKHMKKYWCK